MTSNIYSMNGIDSTSTNGFVIMSYEERVSRANILSVLKKLYCRNICSDFRKPVISAYPDLAQTYRAVVKEPMDLGTLIVKVNKGLVDLVEIKRLLKLIFSNALTFNEGSYTMEAISHHISVFIKGLWEEAFQSPFLADISSSQFALQRLQSRAERFIFILNEPLLIPELHQISSLLSIHTPDEFTNVHSRLLDGITSSIASNQLVSLHTILTPLYNDLQQGVFNRTTINAQSAPSLNTPAILYGTSIQHVSSLSDTSLKYLSFLDESLGIFLVSLCERKLRGTDNSVIWGRPQTLLWAQPPKSAWCPCILLAGGDTSDAVAITNISRIPEAISKQLVRMKPKVTATTKFGVALTVYTTRTISTKILNPPEGYVLVEFFGSHDFGWLKVENTAPMTKDGTPPTTSNLIPNEAAILEALDWISSSKKWNDIQYDEDLPLDDTTLETSIITPPEVKVVKVLPEGRQKRKKEIKEDKSQKYSPHSLFLSNKVVVPSFQTIASDASKKEVALQKTKLMVAWANFVKPLTTRGRSPFVNADAVLLSSATTNTTKPMKRPLGNSEVSASKKLKAVAAEQRVEEMKGDASTVSLTDANYQKEAPTLVSLSHFIGCITDSSGDGIIHTKLIDLNADIFFRENRKPDARKLILRAELQRVHDSLRLLQQVAQARLEDNKVVVSGVVRRIIVNPHRSGSEAVGNAKIGLARYFLYQQTNRVKMENSMPLPLPTRYDAI